MVESYINPPETWTLFEKVWKSHLREYVHFRRVHLDKSDDVTVIDDATRTLAYNKARYEQESEGSEMNPLFLYLSVEKFTIHSDLKR